MKTSWHLLPTDLSTLYSSVLDFTNNNLNYLFILMHRRQFDGKTPKGEIFLLFPSIPHFSFSYHCVAATIMVIPLLCKKRQIFRFLKSSAPRNSSGLWISHSHYMCFQKSCLELVLDIHFTYFQWKDTLQICITYIIHNGFICRQKDIYISII